jgi:hypothetical protein
MLDAPKDLNQRFPECSRTSILTVRYLGVYLPAVRVATEWWALRFEVFRAKWGNALCYTVR